jgi:hypothetical protein
VVRVLVGHDGGQELQRRDVFLGTTGRQAGQRIDERQLALDPYWIVGGRRSGSSKAPAATATPSGAS